MPRGDDDSLRALWQAQPLPPAAPLLDASELRRRDARLRRTVGWRNAREYAAGALVAATFAGMAVRAPTLALRGACLAIVLSTGYVVWTLRRRGSSPAPPPDDAPASAHLAHHRAALVRQRDLLRQVPRFYLAPLYAAILVFYAAAAASRPDLALAVRLARAAGPLAVTTLVFALIGRMNLRAARALEGRIAALGEDGPVR